jgi:hypothetical protein
MPSDPIDAEEKVLKILAPGIHAASLPGVEHGPQRVEGPAVGLPFAADFKDVLSGLTRDRNEWVGDMSGPIVGVSPLVLGAASFPPVQ